MRELNSALTFGTWLLYLIPFTRSFSLAPIRPVSPLSWSTTQLPSQLSSSRVILASSFYGKFDEEEEEDGEDEEEEDDDDEDDEDYEGLDDAAVADFRSKMSNIFGDSTSEDSQESSVNSVDELINFARGKDSSLKGGTDTSTEWARVITGSPTAGVVLVANPARFCRDFGDEPIIPSPSLLAKFGLTLPPPADLGPDRRADLLPVLVLVDMKDQRGDTRAVLLNRRTGYLLGDLEQQPGDGSSILDKFCIQPLWFGGVDNVSSGLDMLHLCPVVQGANALTEDGLYWGGDPAQAQDAMTDASLDRVFSGFDFKFFVQSTLWSPGELEKEIANGTWFCASVSKEVLFKSRDRMGTQRAKPLWSEIMELLGGKHSNIRNELYEEEGLQ